MKRENTKMTTIIIVSILIIVIFLTIVTTAVKIASKKEQNIYTTGIEVESVVAKCEHYFDRDHDSRYRCYVKYVGNDNLEHEGLLNVRTNLPIGRTVRVKYLPGKYEEVVFVSQEID